MECSKSQHTFYLSSVISNHLLLRALWVCICKVYVHMVLLECWSFPALGWHQKWHSHGTDAYWNSNKFTFILFPTSVCIGRRISTRTGAHVSEFLCGLWLQWFSGCCSFTVSSACICSSCVKTARFSSEFKDEFFILVEYQWVLIVA